MDAGHKKGEIIDFPIRDSLHELRNKKPRDWFVDEIEGEDKRTIVIFRRRLNDNQDSKNVADKVTSFVASRNEAQDSGFKIEVQEQEEEGQMPAGRELIMATDKESAGNLDLNILAEIDELLAKNY